MINYNYKYIKTEYIIYFYSLLKLSYNDINIQ